MTIYRSKVQLTPEELKVQCYLDNRKIQVQEPPAATGPRNQGEVFNEYKAGNKAQVSLF